MLVSCFSDDSDPVRAGESVGRKLDGCEYSLVFVNHTYDAHKVVKAMRETCNTMVFGCSSSYGISDENLVERGVCALGFSSRELVGGFAAEPMNGGYECGRSVAERAFSELSTERDRLTPIFARYNAIVSNMPEKIALSKPYFYMMDFINPMRFADEDFLHGVRDFINPTVPLVGAGSFTDVHTGRNYQILNEAYSDSAVLGIFATNKSIGLSSEVAFVLRDPSPYIVTKALNNRVYELNYRPALEVYSGITGRSSAELREERTIAYSTGAEYPFVVFGPGDKVLMKYPAMVNDDDSITFGTKTADGSVLFSAKNDRKKMIESATKAVKQALKDVRVPQVLVIFDCWQRLAAMGEEYEKEAEAIINAAHGVNTIATYTMGEHFSMGTMRGHRNGSIVAVAMGD